MVATDLYNPDTGSKMPDIDKLFSQVPLPEDFEDSASDSARANLPKSEQVQLGPNEIADQTTRFGPLVTNSQIICAQKATVPANTQKSTNWAMNMWNEWADYRKRTHPDE